MEAIAAKKTARETAIREEQVLASAIRKRARSQSKLRAASVEDACRAAGAAQRSTGASPNAGGDALNGAMRRGSNRVQPR